MAHEQIAITVLSAMVTVLIVKMFLMAGAKKEDDKNRRTDNMQVSSYLIDILHMLNAFEKDVVRYASMTDGKGIVCVDRANERDLDIPGAVRLLHRKIADLKNRESLATEMFFDSLGKKYDNQYTIIDQNEAEAVFLSVASNYICKNEKVVTLSDITDVQKAYAEHLKSQKSKGNK